MDSTKYIALREDNSWVEMYKKTSRSCGTNYNFHRKDGPAYIHYNEKNSIIYEGYWINGRRHRKDGPAIIRYADNGIIEEVEYYIDGHHLTEEEFKDFLFKKSLKGTPMGEIFLTKV